MGACQEIDLGGEGGGSVVSQQVNCHSQTFLKLSPMFNVTFGCFLANQLYFADFSPS